MIWTAPPKSANELAIEVGDAVEGYLKAKAERDLARERCEYDWGYYGTKFEDEVVRRAAFLGQALDAFNNRREEG